MKRKIFLQFFLITLLSTLLMFVCGVVAVNANARKIVKDKLAEETQLVVSLVNDREDISALSNYQSQAAFRITALSTDGDVLYDSDTTAQLENHADREEFINALSGTPKAVERYSDTFRTKMTYYAMKTTLDDGTDVVIRLAVKSSDISSYIDVSLPLMLLVFVAVLALSMSFAGLICKRISKKVAKVGDSLKSLNEGDYKPLDAHSDEPEFYALFNEINDLNANIYLHIAQEEQEKRKLNAVLDNVSQGIVALSAKRQVLFANTSACRLFGGQIAPHENDLVYLIENAALHGKIVRHLGENYTFEWTEREKVLSICLTKPTDEKLQNEISAIVIVTDITSEKDAVRQKSEFFANASHELKTPITVMQGLTEVLLSKEIADETTKKQVERIHKESLRLSSLVSDMLKLSKLENGEREETALPVDLRATAEEVFAELADAITEKHIQTRLTGEGVVCADPKKMYELLQNLCSNAVHYNKEGGSIEVELSETDENVCLYVRDTGIGIEKEHLPRLCERFYRVDRSRSKRTGGTGLGLAIVKHICALYNANLVIESEYGEGTTVSVKFRKS